MLILLVSHHKENQHHIDKLINIEGLPQEWFFYEKEGRKYIKGPWEIAPTTNLPPDIRTHFQPQPMKICSETPMEFRVGDQPQAPRWITQEHDAYALRIDYQNGPGHDMWEQVEEILDRETPRHLKVPKPAKVGDRQTWKLQASEVPSVRLNGAEPVIVPGSPPVARPNELVCDQCQATFEKDRALWMHR